MVNADLTEMAVFRLEPMLGKGTGLLVGRWQIDDAETIVTGFNQILSLVVQDIGTASITHHLIAPTAHTTTGTLTFDVRDVNAYANGTGHTFYVWVVGIKY